MCDVRLQSETGGIFPKNYGCKQGPARHSTALAALRGLVIGRLAERDVCSCAYGRLCAIPTVEGLARYDLVDVYSVIYGQQLTISWRGLVHDDLHTRQDILKSELDVAGVQGRGFDEGQMVRACERPYQSCLSGRIWIKKLGSLANSLASSVGTALRCLKSLLLPTSMMTRFASAYSRSSLSHRVTFS
jgi:hypothetical protein